MRKHYEDAIQLHEQRMRDRESVLKYMKKHGGINLSVLGRICHIRNIRFVLGDIRREYIVRTRGVTRLTVLGQRIRIPEYRLGERK